MTKTKSTVVALIPAYNEADSIADTIEAVLAQTRGADQIIVIPNGCSDNTAEIARAYPVTVMELPKLAHRKSEALNRAWAEYAQDADVVICLYADTILPENAVEDWSAELSEDPDLGGSSSKFTVHGSGVLSRIQKAEYSAWADLGLRKGSTSVLSGTGSAFRGDVLLRIAENREGPWSYRSITEDYELTYRIREMGFKAIVSPTVRAYTDSMPNIRSIWGQRIKWQVGTGHDLIHFGFNRLTRSDWGRQAATAASVMLRVLSTAVVLAFLFLDGGLSLHWAWLILPLLGIALSVKRSLRVPHRDWKDVLLAASFIPNELFMWVRTGWFIRGWWLVIFEKISGRTRDHWAAQYKAEGMGVI